MVIKSEIYKDYKYNENIFLDYLDHDFMREMNRVKKNILVMNDNVLKQDFSMESNSLEASYKRLCILNHDLKEYYKEDYIMYLYQILAYKLVMIKKYKSLKFVLLKNLNRRFDMKKYILDLGTKIIQKTRYRNNIIDYKPIIDNCDFDIVENNYNGGKKIGILLPHLVKSSGGVTSILRLGTNLSKLGYQLTYISMFNDNEKDMVEAAKFNLSNYEGECLPLNKTNKNDFDIIVATEWRTVYRIMDFDAYKMYFVQDFEPIFFEMGERYLLSKKTYELGLHIVSLGKWNVDTVVKSCDVKGQIDYIEFPYEKTEYTFVKRNFEK